MNCKQGDLAVIVRSRAGNEGKIVRCVRFLGPVNYTIRKYVDSWEIDPPVMSFLGTLENAFPDDQLRPIRPSEGQDETLTWAGKPEGVTT